MTVRELIEELEEIAKRVGDLGRRPIVSTRSGLPQRKRKTEAFWMMRCDCGQEREFKARQVRDGNSQSCGCLRKEIQIPADIDAAFLRRMFTYDPLTGTFVRLVRSGRLRAGTVAGSVHNNGRVSISLRGKHYLAHRLAWLYVDGELPLNQIDHADGNPLNNAISNLRLCTPSENMANTKLSRLNALGLKGVVRTRAGLYDARIKCQGKLYLLGATFKTAAEAKSAYDAKARELFGEFARSA